MSELIYKIVGAKQWREAQADHRFDGSSDDRADGFIHFSTASQVAETLSRHFAGQRDLVLVAVDPERLGNDLRWEESRGGEKFPHLYGPLRTSDVASVTPIRTDENGRHSFDLG
jgi:uncharacterized protein (DUF952 family)